jgi:hypothetical protein
MERSYQRGLVVDNSLAPRAAFLAKDFAPKLAVCGPCAYLARSQAKLDSRENEPWSVGGTTTTAATSTALSAANRRKK